MQEQTQELSTKSKKVPLCAYRGKSKINVDCVKICPFNDALWAFSFYQQHPQFTGGIQVLLQTQIQNRIPHQSQSFLNLGPIMHLQWLNDQTKKSGNQKLYILAVHRNNQAVICSYLPWSGAVVVQKEIGLGINFFCLYCDWKIDRIAQGEGDLINKQIVAFVSTNQSTVFQISLTLGQLKQDKIKQHPKLQTEITINEISQYHDHQYAVWACKVHQSENYLVVGDQVDSLYLYDYHNKIRIARNRQAHSQGICQLVWLDKENILSGSFDGSIAQISVNNFQTVLKKYDIGGTIWRIILPNSVDLPHEWLICNSSEKKFQILNESSGLITWDSGEQHQSLAYAADWSSKRLITASFYDQSVRQWSWVPKS